MTTRYALALIDAILAACSAHEPSNVGGDVVLVEVDSRSASNRHPARVTTGMSPYQVEALMGKSQQTCWRYRDDVLERSICFRDEKVSVISTLEDRPGKNQARIDAVFTTNKPIRAEGQSNGLALGMSPRQVIGLLGTPRVIVEQYDDSTASYWATFMDGKLTAFENVTPRSHY